MSKITNDGLTRSGTGCFIEVGYPYGNGGRQRAEPVLILFVVLVGGPQRHQTKHTFLKHWISKG